MSHIRNRIIEGLAVRSLHRPPATPQFRRTLCRLLKAPTYPRVVTGDVASARSLAVFYVSAASLRLGVSGRRIYFRGGRKAEMAETGLHWQRRFWSAHDASLRAGTLEGRSPRSDEHLQRSIVAPEAQAP